MTAVILVLYIRLPHCLKLSHVVLYLEVVVVHGLDSRQHSCEKCNSGAWLSLLPIVGVAVGLVVCDHQLGRWRLLEHSLPYAQFPLTCRSSHLAESHLAPCKQHYTDSWLKGHCLYTAFFTSYYSYMYVHVDIHVFA